MTSVRRWCGVLLYEDNRMSPLTALLMVIAVKEKLLLRRFIDFGGGGSLFKLCPPITAFLEMSSLSFFIVDTLKTRLLETSSSQLQHLGDLRCAGS
uniref:Uncharacterized protein n=1 Tax=Lepeophtheirus salmonis TaxID=72036 RepID=A0A0K2T8P4_LEPSM